MKPVPVLIWIVAALALLFMVLNWNTPVSISFGFARAGASLGVVLLVLILATHRRHSDELRSQRELADNAEASRYTELRQYLQQQLAALAESQRLTEQRLQQEIHNTGNSLSACIGEIDERLERQWPSTRDKQP